MNPLEIEAFLAITETRNLSKAADKLFVSQSTISSRLTNLESEIGSPLVNRRPGIKGVTLTPKGNEFLTLASRYLEVEKDIKTWKENLSCYELKVSAPHSINSFLFTGLYSRFSGSSQLRLTILSLIHIYRCFRQVFSCTFCTKIPNFTTRRFLADCEQ